jgi:hypothetical protein
VTKEVGGRWRSRSSERVAARASGRVGKGGSSACGQRQVGSVGGSVAAAGVAALWWQQLKMNLWAPAHVG